MKLTTILRKATVPLALAAFAVNAMAASPTHPSGLNAPMITAEHFNQETYQAREQSNMFPAPTAGMVQHILTFPKLDNEADYRVEIEIGQTKMVDCNKHGLNGELKEVTLKGWGYNYYVVEQIAAGPSTQMACFDQAKTEAFVRIPMELTLNYDSRLPKVFYLPEDAELRYRIWKLDSTYQYSK